MDENELKNLNIFLHHILKEALPKNLKHPRLFKVFKYFGRHEHEEKRLQPSRPTSSCTELLYSIYFKIIYLQAAIDIFSID